MGSFSFLGKGPHLKLVLDIGTESAKAVLYEKKDGKRVIFDVVLEYFDDFGTWDGFFSQKERLSAAPAYKAIERTLAAAAEKSGKRGVELYVALPPHFSHPRVVTMVFERQNPHAHISQKEEEAIISRGEREAWEIVKKGAGELYGISPNELSSIVFRPTSFSIDGYRVPSLRNFNGKKVVWSALAIVARKEGSVQSELFQFLVRLARDLKMIFSHSSIISLAEGVAAAAPFLEDGVFIDIGGRATQVFVVSKKALLATLDFPLGARQLCGVIAADLGIPEREAREFVERYSSGVLTEGTAARFRELLKVPILEWYDTLKNRLGGESAQVVPSFFLFGGGGTVPLFREVLETAKDEDFLFAGSPRVSELVPANLPHVEYKGKKMVTPQHTSSFFLTYHVPTEKKNF